MLALAVTQLLFLGFSQAGLTARIEVWSHACPCAEDGEEVCPSLGRRLTMNDSQRRQSDSGRSCHCHCNALSKMFRMIHEFQRMPALDVAADTLVQTLFAKSFSACAVPVVPN